MIISASRRTDIPCYYSEWFFNRLREGCVLVRNPMNFQQVSQINLSPEVVDGIVFWTKNPAPMIDRLSELKEYPYYFQYTITPYGKEIEPGVPEKESAVETFQRLADILGPERVVWRYDPVSLNDKYTAEAHIAYFGFFARKLKGFTRKCTFSFIDRYKNTQRNEKILGLCEVAVPDQLRLAKAFSEIASACGMELGTCAEQMNLQQFGIRPACCVDDRLFAKLSGYPLKIEKDKNQRPECGCVSSIDIGMYNTCRNGCLYCYANYNAPMVEKNFREHNPASPLLSGCLKPNDRIKERKMVSCKNGQIGFFDEVGL